MTDYVFYLNDICCHLRASSDLGDTWSDTFPDEATLSDGYADLAMAINDGDYTTMLMFDIGVEEGKQGLLVTSLDAGIQDSWVFSNPDPARNPPNDADNYVEWFTAGMTAGGKTIILCAPYSASGGVADNTGFLRITHNNGSTWADTATELGPRQWLSCCVVEGGGTIYAVSASNAVSVSQDGGATWGDIPGSPILPAIALFPIVQARIRCTPDGDTLVLAVQGGVGIGTNRIWVSTNAGVTWSNPLSMGGIPDGSSFVDCGLSTDGTKMIAILHGFTNSTPLIWFSTNSGTSWSTFDFTTIRAGFGYNIPGDIYPQACNISPDGVMMLVGMQNSGGPNAGEIAAYSDDDGVSWIWKEDPVEFGASFQVNTAYVIPPPTPPTPPEVPPAAYIIERLDNRIWPTVEDSWCVDCGFTLAQPTPDAGLDASSPTGAGIILGVENLVGGAGYSDSTVAEVVDNNGLGPGTGAEPLLTITGGVITAISFVLGGADYVYPRLVINDPTNAGSGASADLTLDTSATFTTSDPVFSSGDIGSVIRAGYGSAVITEFTDTQTVTATILVPLVKTRPDSPDAPAPMQTQKSGTWTMTVPVSQVYLPQLAGFTVTGLADGKVVSPRVVPDDGLVTLDEAASAIILGLGFVAQLQSNRLDAGEPTIQGQRKKIAAVTARLESSAAFMAGANQPDGAAQNPIEIAPEWQDLVDAPTHAIPPFSGAATPLFTGDVRLPLPGGWNTRGQVALQQDQPLPLQILDLVPETLPGDDPSAKVPPRQKKEK